MGRRHRPRRRRAPHAGRHLLWRGSSLRAGVPRGGWLVLGVGRVAGRARLGQPGREAGPAPEANHHRDMEAPGPPAHAQAAHVALRSLDLSPVPFPCAARPFAGAAHQRAPRQHEDQAQGWRRPRVLRGRPQDGPRSRRRRAGASEGPCREPARPGQGRPGQRCHRPDGAFARPAGQGRPGSLCHQGCPRRPAIRLPKPAPALPS